MDLKEETIATLKHFDIGEKFSCLPLLPKASVLVPLFVRNGELFVLLTRRSEQLRISAGEVCFPGGKRDPEDSSDVHTALREAKEEIGLQPDDVQVVCTLIPIQARGFLVTPVVGFIKETFRPTLNPAEVSAVFSVPLDFFIHEKDHSGYTTAGNKESLHCFEFMEPESERRFHIWGMTAVLSILVAVLALRKKTEFNVSFDSNNPLAFFQQKLQTELCKL